MTSSGLVPKQRQNIRGEKRERGKGGGK